MKACTIRVSGQVQGVFFRASTKAAADRLGVRGKVRNEEDGSVFIEAEGEDAAVDQLVEWCRKGPPRARVESVDVTPAQPKGVRGFSVERRGWMT